MTAEWDEADYLAQADDDRLALVDSIRAALANAYTYSENVRRLASETARCHICVAGSASEGDTQGDIDAHRAHRDALRRIKSA